MNCRELLPVPNFPNVPDPQHLISLLSSTAQVMSHPACIVEAEYTEPAWDPGEYKPE